ncbi:MAG: hypothetical protein CM15mP9_1190 [Methanobacteriota archaeon]|nr:MAG: hypothetical protein CM15mP9_1190 [Euryarchaeota archaeon]
MNHWFWRNRESLVVSEDHPGWPYAKGGIVAINHRKRIFHGTESPDEDRFWLKLETEHGDFDLRNDSLE